MRSRLYGKLAVNSIVKNKQLFFPHILAGVMMTVVYFILYSLSKSSAVEQLPAGGVMLVVLLRYSVSLVGFFSIPFLIYTNSTLFKNRAPEFGLYNVLGIGRIALIPLVFIENLITFLLVVANGLIIGSLLFKMAEMSLVRIMKGTGGSVASISIPALVSTVVWFAIVFMLLFIYDTMQLLKKSTVDLLSLSNVGDKELKYPKATTIIGIVILACCYCVSFWISTRGESPLKYILICFIFFCGIIISTYLLFISGSVFICSSLQKNNEFYYKPKHFITVSSLKHRMKRNGAGLASISILATFVLLTLTFSFAFYKGSSSLLELHYPNDMSIVVMAKEGNGIDRNNSEHIMETLENNGLKESTVRSTSAAITTSFEDGVIRMNEYIYSKEYMEKHHRGFFPSYDDLIDLRVMSVEDYNALCGTEVELGGDDVLLVSKHDDILKSARSLVGFNGGIYNLIASQTMPTMSEVRYISGYPEGAGIKESYLIVNDVQAFTNVDKTTVASYGDVYLYEEYDVKMSGSEREQLAIGETVKEELEAGFDNSTSTLRYGTRAEKKEKIIGLSGGLLFLAFIISMIFILMASIIIYYKQISEGYEDRSQYNVMRKIGLSRIGINRTVKFQVMFTFLSPIIFAGVHLLFLTPILYKMISSILVCSKSLVFATNMFSFIMYAAIYIGVYKLTSNEYLKQIT